MSENKTAIQTHIENLRVALKYGLLTEHEERLLNELESLSLHPVMGSFPVDITKDWQVHRSGYIHECPKCKTEIREISKFCNHCRIELPITITYNNK